MKEKQYLWLEELWLRLWLIAEITLTQRIRVNVLVWSTTKIQVYMGLFKHELKQESPFYICISGDVNVTLSCCVYNDKMFHKDTMISANAYRCEILVCEQKVIIRKTLL